jgi:hypothetical protein
MEYKELKKYMLKQVEELIKTLEKSYENSDECTLGYLRGLQRARREILLARKPREEGE